METRTITIKNDQDNMFKIMLWTGALIVVSLGQLFLFLIRGSIMNIIFELI
jgi:hypothetical protein